MKKNLLLTLLFSLIAVLGFSQTDRFWSANMDSRGSIITDKAVSRLAYPKEFKLFNLNIEPLRQQLFTIVDHTGASTEITLPNADGKLEKFQVYEASNFDPSLQASYPQIRAYSGRGITDRYATLKLSIAPNGIQTMVFRADNPAEFMEPYSKDHSVYSVFKSQREKGKLPWVCSTVDQQMVTGLNEQVAKSGGPLSNTGELRTARLAQSCNGEYANYFGATPANHDTSLVYAAYNATLTRCNGCYEKDLALHLNLISNFYEDMIIFFDPNTDPYTTLANWNSQLQNLLNTTVGDPNYDIGHMFGGSGGGGNAGCIGCICVNGTKGSGITSPADGIPMGDNFDIDYVVHEVGHQLGGNHTFTYSNEGTQAQKEVGAGITIMGYAGITSYDPAPHSIDIYHETSIAQIQANLATKSCPVLVTMTANHPPVVAALSNYTIPITTPFYLTGSATDPENDPITYCWEEDDNSNNMTGANSVAFPTKASGPNWLSFVPTTSPTRLCPKLSTILSGLFITPPWPGGDAICNIEALSSVSRTLNFRLTVVDNHPYVPGSTIGQTQFQNMTVTVTNTSGPFQVTSPNTNVSWAGGSTQTVTWLVNNTTAAPVSCANVKITLSTDGGTTFPTVLAASVTNNGSASVTIPNTPSTTARIKVEAVGNIFFDISDANFTITASSSGFTFNAPTSPSSACPAPASMSTSLTAVFGSGFTNPITLSASGNPGGTTVTFGTNPLTPGSPTTTVNLNGTNTLAYGTYTITVTGVASGAPNQTQNISYIINPGAGPAVTAQPSPQTLCVGLNTSFSITSAAATSFQWQVSTDGGATWNNVTNGGVYTTATTATLNITGVTAGMTGYQYRCVASVLCGFTNSSNAVLTVQTAPAITSQPVATTVCGGSSASFSVTATGTGLTYQWQVSTNSCATWNNIANGAPYSGVTTATLTITLTTPAMSSYAYRCVVNGTCSPSVTTNSCINLTVNTPIAITAQPANATICAGSNTSFSTTVSGTGPAYQWQLSTDGGATWNNVTNGGVYSNATTATLNLTGVTAGMTGYQYRCVITGTAPCGSVNSNGGTLTVNTSPAITAQPVAGTTICAAQNTSYSVTANGTALTYQWQVSTDGGTTYNSVANGGVYSGATTSALTITAATVAMNTYRYRCVISGTCAPAATSTAAVLTVYTPISITTAPASATICATGTTSFTVAASGTGPAYQWQESTNGGTTWNNITNGGIYSGATTTTLTLTGVTPAMNNNQYRNAVAGSAPCGTVNSASATLTVSAQPTVTLTASPYTKLFPGYSTVITASVNPPTGFTTVWTRNGNPITVTGNAKTVTVNELGIYTVVATIGTCVSVPASITISDSASSKLWIYPSPNNGQFTISYYNPGGGATSQNVTIYDSKGATVWNAKYPVTQAYQLIPIDMRRNSAGLYFVVLRLADGSKVKTGTVVIR